MTSKVRLYFSDKLAPGTVSKLSEKQSHYVKNVVRLNRGDKISIFNSNNGEWDAVILAHGKELTEFKVEKQSRPQEDEHNLWLAFSPIKKIPQDLMLQKTTELGIKKFLPILCERSVVREINIERASKIVTEASEQSNRISVPEILKTQSLITFLKNFPENGHLIFCDINSDTSNFKKILTDKNPICILVGPEGDFSEKERLEILNFDGVQPIKINENILRSETAVISAISIINYAIN